LQQIDASELSSFFLSPHFRLTSDWFKTWHFLIKQNSLLLKESLCFFCNVLRIEILIQKMIIYLNSIKKMNEKVLYSITEIQVCDKLKSWDSLKSFYQRSIKQQIAIWNFHGTLMSIKIKFVFSCFNHYHIFINELWFSKWILY
jgi:hypothetical protein